MQIRDQGPGPTSSAGLAVLLEDLTKAPLSAGSETEPASPIRFESA